ncbi:MAG: PBP1A family penicillin-binding protein [Desulfuromonadales bacterium]
MEININAWARDKAASLIRNHLFCILVITLLSIFAPLDPAHALEAFAAYPALPAGYSSIKVFDNKGSFVGRVLPEQRYWVPIERIPQFLQKAVVAVEDSRFYEHGGIDVLGIARAVYKDVVKGRLAEGGSTITQQLIKNMFLTGEKSIDRKVKEGILALEFEQKYSKKQILEMYFNEIYYGNGAWGIAQAARLYFDKNPEELTDAECSLLAGVQKNPGRYNPLGKSVDVGMRRDVVLKRMVALGMIETRRQAELRNKPPVITPPSQAPSYLSHIRATLLERLGKTIVDQGGLEVTTAMDLALQKLAEKTLQDGVKRVSPQLQGALVCLDPQNGDLLAIVGGVESGKTPFNRVFLARRQPGSSIKPLIYATALEQGITAASIWNDTPVSYDRGNGEHWVPHNYDGKSHGNMSLRQALASSNNIVAVKLLEQIGMNSFADQALKLGLSLRGRDLSLALGTDEVTPVELAIAYAPFANGGSRPEPRSIIKIYDTNRRVWSENPPILTPALSPAAAYITTQMLKDVLISGTARNLKKFAMEHPAAGKTGTTNDYRDAWFVGYTPQMVTGIWVGYDKPKPGGKGFTGGAVAAPIWGTFMRQAMAGRAVTDFVRPDSVVSIGIDSTGDCLAPDNWPEKHDEYFISGSDPKRYCDEVKPPPEPQSAENAITPTPP